MDRRKFVQNSSLLLALSPTSVPWSRALQDSKTIVELEEISIDHVRAMYKSGSASVESLTRSFLARIESLDQNGPELNSVIQINPNAIEDAKILDAEMKNGQLRGSMHGIPVLLKDNIDTRDIPTTAGSLALKNSYPQKDSWVASKLRSAGALILGKTNLSEWANFRGRRSSSGWSGLGGLTKNPYFLDRNPCGSSSGSGVAVSASLCVVAIGTETNGSIICPSNANGIVGIKPTVGLVSRSGIIPISSTQDTAGPMARTVKDATICLGALTGIDAEDEITALSHGNFHTDYSVFLRSDGLKGKKLAYFTPTRGRHKKVDELMEKAIADMETAGAQVIEIDQISAPEVSRNSFQVMLYEYKEGLNKYFASLGPDAPIKNLEELIEFNKTNPEELAHFGQEYLIMAQEKGDLKSDEYISALKNMLSGRRAEGIDKVMDQHQLDGIIAPSGGPAWKTDLVNGDNSGLGSSSPAAQAGYPNITVPMGFISGLPVGVSFFGRAWSEPVLIEMSYAYEQATRHRQAPQYKDS